MMKSGWQRCKSIVKQLENGIRMAGDWIVYLLLCSDNSLYCGITNDLAKRLAKHNSGKGSKYTRARLPVMVIKIWDVAGKSAALKLEAKIKKMPKDKKLSFKG